MAETRISQRVLVTGAVGNVGREVVRALRSRGVPFRAADLVPDAVTAMHGAQTEAVRLDFDDDATYSRALDGCDSLFLVRPPAVCDVQNTLVPFVDVAMASGVRHIVFLSVAGAATNKLVPHHAVEKHLEERQAAATILRPCFFAQNLGAAYKDDIAEDDRLYLPAGRGRVAFVDIRDVAELAALILSDPAPHAGQAYTCTGPEALSFEEAARLLTDVIGRTIRYEPASIAGYVRHLHVQGLPLAQIGVQTLLHIGLRFGQREHVDPTLGELLGRRPRTLAAYVRDAAQLWDRPERAPSSSRYIVPSVTSTA